MVKTSTLSCVKDYQRSYRSFLFSLSFFTFHLDLFSVSLNFILWPPFFRKEAWYMTLVVCFPFTKMAAWCLWKAEGFGFYCVWFFEFSFTFFAFDWDHGWCVNGEYTSLIYFLYFYCVYFYSLTKNASKRAKFSSITRISHRSRSCSYVLSPKMHWNVQYVVYLLCFILILNIFVEYTWKLLLILFFYFHF